MWSYLAKPELRLALVSAFVLAACGGGGGGSTDSTSAANSSGSTSSTGGSSNLTAIKSSFQAASVTGYPAVSTNLIQLATGVSPPVTNSSDTGAFRTVCTFSHMGYNDPIVFPGQPGASHLHAFFGNANVGAGNDASPTIDLNAPSTCRGGALNRTGYWVPSMVSPSGDPQAPEDMVIYYKTGYQGVNNGEITRPPDGLKMIAGNSKSTGAQDMVEYACGSPWAPGFITADFSNPLSSIPTCNADSQLVMRVTFPQCWDGVNLDSPDHKSHMQYGNPNPQAGKLGCPVGYKAIPEIVYNVKWRIRSGNTAGWRLSSDIAGSPAGSSGHGDWWMGWDHTTMDTWITNCDNGNVDCGTYLLGNGNMLTGAEATQ